MQCNDDIILFKITAERAGWGALAIGFGIYILVLVFEALIQNAPPAEWLPRLTFSVLFLLAYFAPKLASWIEGDRSETSGFGLADWTVLIVFVLWVVAGPELISAGFKMDFWAIKASTLFGAIGVVAILYTLYQEPRSGSSVA
jgi:hypothetical protein